MVVNQERMKMLNKDIFELPITIENENIVVTRREHEHDDALWNLIDVSRKFLRPWLSWVDRTKSIDDVIPITDLFLKNWENHDGFEYVVIDKKTKELVAAGGINVLDYRNHSAEFGYYRKENACAKGYVTQFVQLLEAELKKRNVHRVVINADVENIPSQNVAIRCGYKREGISKDAIFDGEKYKDKVSFAKIFD